MEADRSSIIGKYIGHTEDNMRKLIQKPLGVLFIDEAYALAKGGQNDFGQEAVDVLVKAMEDHRGDLVVILAGYQEEMEELLDLNTGLQSRIPFKFYFPDYSADELLAIMKKQIASNQLILSLEAEQALVLVVRRETSFNGNVRWARNFVEKIRLEANNRIAQIPTAQLQLIEVVDIENAATLLRS